MSKNNAREACGQTTELVRRSWKIIHAVFALSDYEKKEGTMNDLQRMGLLNTGRRYPGLSVIIVNDYVQTPSTFLGRIDNIGIWRHLLCVMIAATLPPDVAVSSYLRPSLPLTIPCLYDKRGGGLLPKAST